MKLSITLTIAISTNIIKTAVLAAAQEIRNGNENLVDALSPDLEKKNYAIFFDDGVLMDQHFNPFVDYLLKQNITITEQDHEDELKFVVASLNQQQKQEIINLKEQYKIDEIESDQSLYDNISDGILKDYNMPSNDESEDDDKINMRKPLSFGEKDEF